MHDSDNNNKLDGSELIKSLIHWHGESILLPILLCAAIFHFLFGYGAKWRPTLIEYNLNGTGGGKKECYSMARDVACVESIHTLFIWFVQFVQLYQQNCFVQKIYFKYFICFSRSFHIHPHHPHSVINQWKTKNFATSSWQHTDTWHRSAMELERFFLSLSFFMNNKMNYDSHRNTIITFTRLNIWISKHTHHSIQLKLGFIRGSHRHTLYIYRARKQRET